MRATKIISGMAAFVMSIIVSLFLPSEAARFALCTFGAMVGISLVGWGLVTLIWGGGR